jgi:DNA polymerase III gamma/tau subunit
MLPTVASRCQPVKFGRLSTDLVAQILTSDFNIEKERAAIAAELAGGQITRALEFADPERSDTILGIVESLQSLSERIRACDALLGFLSERRQKIAEEADQKISNFGEDLDSAIKTSNEDLRKSFIDKHYRELLNDCFGLLLTFYRDVLVLKETKAEELIINRNKMELLRKQAEALSSSTIAKNMADIEQASEYCSHYVAEDRVFLDLLLRLRN